MPKKKQDPTVIPGPPVPSGGYSLPLIMIGQMKDFVNEVGAKKVTVSTPPPKKFEDEIKPKPVPIKVIKKKKKVTKKKKEKPKEEPERLSPFKLNDVVWAESGGDWRKYTVAGCRKPEKVAKTGLTPLRATQSRPWSPMNAT